MSQQTNAGFRLGRAPGFSVVADDPCGASPGTAAVTAARSGPCERAASRIAPSVERTPLSASEAVGVGQQAIANFAASAAEGVRPAANSLLRTFWLAVGVAHSAAATCLGN